MIGFPGAYEEVNLGFSRFCSLFNVNDFKVGVEVRSPSFVSC